MPKEDLAYGSVESISIYTICRMRLLRMNSTKKSTTIHVI